MSSLRSIHHLSWNAEYVPNCVLRFFLAWLAKPLKLPRCFLLCSFLLWRQTGCFIAEEQRHSRVGLMSQSKCRCFFQWQGRWFCYLEEHASAPAWQPQSLTHLVLSSALQEVESISCHTISLWVCSNFSSNYGKRSAFRITEVVRKTLPSFVSPSWTCLGE